MTLGTDSKRRAVTSQYPLATPATQGFWGILAGSPEAQRDFREALLGNSCSDRVFHTITVLSALDYDHTKEPIAYRPTADAHFGLRLPPVPQATGVPACTSAAYPQLRVCTIAIFDSDAGCVSAPRGRLHA